MILLAPGDPLHGEGPGGPLWGVLDCARDASLFPEVELHAADKQCLFERPPREGGVVAPWLVRLLEGSPLLERWRREGLVAHWGMLFRSEEPLGTIRREFRKRLMVTLPGRMMSKTSYLTDMGGHSMAHVMFFIPSKDGANWGANMAGSPVMGGNYWFFQPEHAAEAATLPPLLVLIVGTTTWSDGTPVATHGM